MLCLHVRTQGRRRLNTLINEDIQLIYMYKSHRLQTTDSPLQSMQFPPAFNYYWFYLQYSVHTLPWGLCGPCVTVLKSVCNHWRFRLSAGRLTACEHEDCTGSRIPFSTSSCSSISMSPVQQLHSEYIVQHQPSAPTRGLFSNNLLQEHSLIKVFKEFFKQ